MAGLAQSNYNSSAPLHSHILPAHRSTLYERPVLRAMLRCSGASSAPSYSHPTAIIRYIKPAFRADRACHYPS